MRKYVLCGPVGNVETSGELRSATRGRSSPPGGHFSAYNERAHCPLCRVHPRRDARQRFPRLAPGTLGYGWALCEGCGTHVFDNAGEPACAPGGQPGLTGLEQRCPLCQASAPGVVLAALWVLVERCCDHDPGEPCQCHEQASADVAALATAGLLAGSAPAITEGAS